MQRHRCCVGTGWVVKYLDLSTGTVPVGELTLSVTPAQVRAWLWPELATSAFVVL